MTVKVYRWHFVSNLMTNKCWFLIIFSNMIPSKIYLKTVFFMLFCERILNTVIKLIVCLFLLIILTMSHLWWNFEDSIWMWVNFVKLLHILFPLIGAHIFKTNVTIYMFHIFILKLLKRALNYILDQFFISISKKNINRYL